MTMPDVEAIIAYENGELDDVGVLTLFSELVSSGLAWSLQGSYGRAAADLIENGYLTETGLVTSKGAEILHDN